MAVCLGLFAGSLGCRVFIPESASSAADPASAAADSARPPLPGQSNEVFVTGHETFGGAVNAFFGRQPVPEQPLEFPHDVHVANEIDCTVCHESVATGPVAGLPSVSTCMICHGAIATDRPRIQQMTALSEQGLDLHWNRVYGYPPEAHVRFNHAPHIRAGVECSTCHGNIGEQTVAQRNVDLTMGFCVNCHNENNASIDCLTCHN